MIRLVLSYVTLHHMQAMVRALGVWRRRWEEMLMERACYFWMLQSFPFIQIKSPQFGASCGMLVATHYFWLTHFMNHFHSMMHVVCFFVLNVWLVPFGFFISLSVNESTLPDRQTSKAGGAFKGF